MNMIKDFIPTGRQNRPGIKITGPLYITVHDTANPKKGANALMHAKYLNGSATANKSVSWHFTVDDNCIVQHLPLDEIGWHAGDGNSGPGNRTSIAIEICENEDGNRAKAEANAAWLCAYLIKALKLDIACIVQHNNWSGKDCPHVIRSRPNGWNIFLVSVKSHLEPKDLYPEGTPQWKKDRVDWMFTEGLLDSQEWKMKLEEPLPLWAIADILRDFMKGVK